jgi:hypothetical protein
MIHTLRRFFAPVLVLTALIPATLLAATAGASAGTATRCVGTADFCGATVSIAGAASTRTVTVNLTDTDFTRVGARVIPPPLGVPLGRNFGLGGSF